MTTEHRTEDEIRREIATEREELAQAMAGLRGGVEAKRGPAKRLAALLGVVALAIVAARLARGCRARCCGRCGRARDEEATRPGE